MIDDSVLSIANMGPSINDEEVRQYIKGHLKEGGEKVELEVYLHSHTDAMVVVAIEDNFTLEHLKNKIAEKFEHHYAEFQNLRGLRVKKFFRRTSISSTDVQSVKFEDIRYGDKLEAEMTSEDVWINMKFNIDSRIQNIELMMDLKIDRQVNYSTLRIILMKTLISCWNYFTNEQNLSNLVMEKYQLNENDIKLAEYLHFHYLFTNISFEAVDEKGEKLSEIIDSQNLANFLKDDFYSKIEVTATLGSIEELAFNQIQYMARKIPDDPKNFRWISFREISSFQNFIRDDHFLNEYNCLKNSIKNIMFNISKTDKFYVYFSNVKLYESHWDGSSSYSDIESNEQVNLIISPKVTEKKKPKKNSQIHEKDLDKNGWKDNPTSTVTSNPETRKFSSVTKRKVYKDSPLLENFLEVDVDEIPKEKVINLKEKRKIPFEELHSAANKIYKIYDEELEAHQFENDRKLSGYKMKLKNEDQKEESLIKIISDARNPSNYLILTDEFKRIITPNIISKLVNLHSKIKLLKFSFEKYSIPEMRKFKYDFSLNEELKSHLMSRKSSIEVSQRKWKVICVIMILLILVALAVIIYIYF